MQIIFSHIRYPLILVGSAILLLLILRHSLDRAPANSLFAQGSDIALLAIYALAFDNEPGSPAALTAYYTPTVRSIISATATAPDRVAVILADLDGYGDTHVLLVQNGVAVRVDGLPDALSLTDPVALEPALIEYDMADGWYLGNFIRWARQLYPTEQTLFSFVGHGAPLTPQLQPLTDGAPQAQPTATPPATPEPAVDLGPLPPRWGAHSDLTDHHSASLLSVRSLAQALSIGTQAGAAPLTVVDLLHCFSATIEELYEIHPYAKTLIAAPNYTYAQPTMLGEMLSALDPADVPSQIAKTLVTGYDALLPIEEHPRLFVAVDADKIAPIKSAWDQTATALMTQWTTDESATRAHLLAAYQASAKYDTTICQPQDWHLAPPDALSDMAEFAGHLGNEFGAQSLVGTWALSTTTAISNAIITRLRHDGVPWFADGETAQEWRFTGAGIALFTDFAPEIIDGQPRYSWQAAWYTKTASAGNPYPYAFIRPAAEGTMTWADLTHRFWTETITSTSGCIQGFVHGRGIGELAVVALAPPTVTIDGSLHFSATIASAQAATNPLVRFRVYDNSEPLYEVVIGSGYLDAGAQVSVQQKTAWHPNHAGLYTLEAAIDIDNRYIEANEADNVLRITVPITVSNRIYLPVVKR